MGSSHKLISIYKFKHLAVSFLFILISSWTQLRFMAEGRTFFRPAHHSWEEEGKAVLNGQKIGSRPPRCERICSSCGHCEAIQVPTNPQIKRGSNSNSPSMFRIEYARRDDSSNYKPMTWKCKCGDSIFNP